MIDCGWVERDREHLICLLIFKKGDKSRTIQSILSSIKTILVFTVAI